MLEVLILKLGPEGIVWNTMRATKLLKDGVCLQGEKDDEG
jgi:hypothetical protein